MSEIILKEAVSESVLQVTLNRPESLNALNEELLIALRDLFLDLQQKPEVRVVCLKGSGKAFCTGGDVKAFFQYRQNPDFHKLFHQMVALLHDLITLVRQSGKIVVSAVNGPAVGAGFSLASAADLVVASESAYFSLGYLKIGLSPDGGSTFFIPRILGLHKTFELLFLNEKLSVQEAKQSGLVAKIFQPDSFDQQLKEFLLGLSQLPPLAIGTAKKLVSQTFYRSLEEQLNQEANGIKQNAASEDFLEGVFAFVEKRTPNFKGK